MKRMRGADARYLYEETPTQHMHTIKVAVLDGSGWQGGYSFERLRDRLAEQSQHLSPLRRRLVPVPLNLSHPYQTNGSKFDPCRHISRLLAPAPGGPRELGRIVSQIASKPLDRTWPLWEVSVVEGLEQGRVALVLKLHHALADGQTSVRLLREILEGSSTQPAAIFPAADRLELISSGVARVRHSIGPLLALWAGLPLLLVRSVKAIRKSRSYPQRPRPYDAPLTCMNRRITARRSCAFATVALADVKNVKDILGCTINDVVLTIAGGALLEYLRQRGEIPGASLTANIPISLRHGNTFTDWGNRTSEVFTSLHTTIEDPVERLRAVHRTMRAARSFHNAGDRGLAEAWWSLGPLAIGGARVLRWLTGAITGRAPCSLIISNVRGPSEPIHYEGARLIGLYSWGVITDTVGLNVTVWSFGDRLSFGVLGCRKCLADPWELADRIPEQLSRLRERVSNKPDWQLSAGSAPKVAGERRIS